MSTDRTNPDRSPRPGGAPRASLGETLERLYDRTGARPTHLLVFTGALVLLALLQSQSGGRILAPAVGHALVVEHPAPAASFVEEAFVRPGDWVEAGAPLATLSRRLLERELALLDAQVERAYREAEMSLSQLTQEHFDRRLSLERRLDSVRRSEAKAAAQQEHLRRLAESAAEMRTRLSSRLEERTARLEELEKTEWMQETYVAGAEEAARVARSESALAEELRRQLKSRPELLRLSEPMLAYHQAAVRELQVQRETVLEQLRSLTIVARSPGRVSNVLSVGTATAEGTSVVSLLPESAAEIIAFVPPQTHPLQLKPGSPVVVAAAGCPSRGTLLRTGAAVTEAPLQVQTRLLAPVRGLPVYLSVPEGCRIGVGQVLSVEFERAGL